ncbi:MAG: SIMPL domain-containing protein [Phycisphaerales bacterium]
MNTYEPGAAGAPCTCTIVTNRLAQEQTMNGNMTASMKARTITGLSVALAALTGGVGFSLASAPRPEPAQAAQASADATGLASLMTQGGTLITATGTATSKKTPDRATVSLGAIATAKTPLAATDQLNVIMDKVVSGVKALKVEGTVIQTQSLSLTPIYDRRNTGEDEPRITGYRASNTVQVQISEIGKAGAVVDAGMGGGANVIQGIWFSLADNAGAEQELLRQASKDARSRAQSMAEGLGLRVIRPLEVQSGGAVRPLAQRFGGEVFSMARAADAAPTVVEAGEASMYASVTVVFLAVPVDGQGPR